MHRQKLIPFFALSYFLTSFGLSADSWWHNAVGRDSFFIFPHLIIYSGVTGTFLLSFYFFMSNEKDRLMKGLLISMSLVVISGLVFDNLWHSIFGAEKIYEIWIALSPPHVLMLAAFITTGFHILLIIEKYNNTIPSDIRLVCDIVVFSSILTYIHFLLSPFFPLGGWGILGLWGEIVTSFPLILLMFLFRQKKRPFGALFAIGLIYLLLFVSGGVFVTKPGVEIIQPNWIIPPAWIIIMAIILPLFIIEVGSYKKHIALKYGLLTGLLYSSINYLGLKFLAPGGGGLSYQDIAIIITGASIGGLLGGLASKKIKLYR